jgi:hypothetical protein
MTERSTPMWLVVAALMVLLATIGASLASEQTQAAICTKNCPPPDEETEESPGPGPIDDPGPDHYSVLVVNVGWGNGSTAGDSPLNPNLLPEYVSYLSGHMNEWFAQSAPTGSAEQRWAISSAGSYSISRPTLPAEPRACSQRQRNLFDASLIDLVHRKLEQQGIGFAKYNLVVISTSKENCGVGGARSGNHIWISRPQYAMHEVGHYLGLTHAEALYCEDGSHQQVTLGDNCEQIAYRDLYDTMGEANTFSYNAIHSNQLGWLSGQFIDLKAPETGTFTISPLTALPHGTRAIRLQDGATRLWIEYRRPVGIDDPLFARQNPYGDWGVFVHREVSIDGETVSQLLDMTPGDDGDFNNARLLGTWANPLGEMTITVNSTTSSGATITISSRRRTVPDLRGLTSTQAEARLAAAGLTGTGWGGIADPTCTLIGLVAAQSPSPGSRILPENPVTVAIGQRDPNSHCQ